MASMHQRGITCRCNSLKHLIMVAEDTKMAFGGLISTSNLMVEDAVHVQSNQPLLWTTEFDDQP